MPNWLTRMTILGAAGGAIIGAGVVGAVWYQTNPNRAVVAEVAGTPITRSQFLSQTEATGGSQTLQQLISDQLIEDGAKKYKLTASNTEIQNALNSLEAQQGIASQAQLQQALTASNMTMQQLNQELKMQVLEQKLAQRGEKVTPQDIQNYYNQNKSSFAQQGQKAPSLNSIKSEVTQAYQQSIEKSPQTVLAELAKLFPVKVLDAKYQSIQQTLASPSSTPAPAPTATATTPPASSSASKSAPASSSTSKSAPASSTSK